MGNIQTQDIMEIESRVHTCIGGCVCIYVIGHVSLDYISSIRRGDERETMIEFSSLNNCLDENCIV